MRHVRFRLHRSWSPRGMTRPPAREAMDSTAVELRGSGQRNEREMLAPVGVAHVKLDTGAWPSANDRMCASTRSSTRPVNARFESRGSGTRAVAESRFRPESWPHFMRLVSVVPAASECQVPGELGAPEGNHNELPCAFSLEDAHQTLDDRDAAALADGLKERHFLVIAIL